MRWSGGSINDDVPPARFSLEDLLRMVMASFAPVTMVRAMTQGEQDEISLGEIARAVKRLEVEFAKHRDESRSRFHELANTMNAALAPIGVHTVQIESQQKAIGRLDDDAKDLNEKVSSVRVQSAWISGGLSAGAAVLEFLFGRHS